MRRYTALKPSKGTTWPPAVSAAIRARDVDCVGPRIGMAGDCLGERAIDHIRASHGMGMKSPSTVENGALLCNVHHVLKTENGKTWRPKLIAYIASKEREAEWAEIDEAMG
ncbi:MAG TPA: hypothetical protein VFJ93_07765 [Gaiellaceae bacterium]|nr:hypothetical protein [Gaiellaceae bacterium]